MQTGDDDMKTLLCYGDSNTHGSLPSADPAVRKRLPPEQRWPGVVRKRLSEAWFVVEEGLGGRTTVHDDPIEGTHKNGLTGLPIALESHRPIDLVTLMLGTNDLKVRFSVSAADIARSIAVLIDFIRASTMNGAGGKAPGVLLIAPPAILEVGQQIDMCTGGAAKSQRFGVLFGEVAKTYGIPFLDASTVVQPSPIDGVHFTAEAHAKLGNAVADKIMGL
jgi:lysophospholipase L1-like esterase